MKNVKIILFISVLFLVLFLIWFFYLRSDKKTTVAKTNENESAYTIVAFGDSLTAGYGLPLYESYPAQLEERLKTKGLEVNVINAGISGETTKGNNERALFIKEQNADMVIWGIGGNDALRALPVEEVKKNMESTIQILQSAQNKPKILILKIQSPLNAGFKYKKEFDAVYENLSKKYDLPLVSFVVSNVFLNPNLMLEDRIHPNKEGYAKIIEDNLLEAVLEEIRN